MMENIGVTVLSYCEKCDMMTEAYAEMQIYEFNNLHNIDPDTYEINEDGDYILNHCQICNTCKDN